MAEKCFLCEASTGGRWLDEATTSTLRQPDTLYNLYAVMDLKRGNFGPVFGSARQEQSAVIEKLKNSKRWYLCRSCWPDR
jgi:hypothetical protein